LPGQVEAARNEAGAVNANGLMTNSLRYIPLGSNVPPVLAVLDAGIKIRERIEAAPFVGHADIQLAWYPETAAPAGGTKINVGRVDLYAVFVLTMKDILCRRQPEVALVTLSSCDYGVRVNRLNLGESVRRTSMSRMALIGVAAQALERGRFAGRKLHQLKTGGSREPSSGGFIAGRSRIQGRWASGSLIGQSREPPAFTQ
jgi:hypothetical protein